MLQATTSPAGDTSAGGNAKWMPGGARVAYALAFALLLALIGWVLVLSLDSVPYSPTSDDGYYLHFMTTVARDGLSAFPGLFKHWNATRIDWLHPPPTRIFFITVSAGLSLVLGAHLTTLSWMSLLSHLGWTAINWLFARRHRGDAFALALAALCGFSPLLLGLGRLALMDSFTCLCVTLAIWLFLEALEQPAVLLWRILFGVAFSLAILTKELSVLLAPPFIAVLLLERYVRKTPLSLRAFALTFIVSALVTGAIFLLAAGGLGPLLRTTRKVLSSPRTNEYALMYCSGPWYRYLIDYFCQSPFPTLLGVMAGGSLIERLRGGAWPRPELLLFVVGAGLLAEQAFMIKNLRYMVALELPLRFLALSWLCALAGRVRTRYRVPLVATVVVTLCVLDWQTFQGFWVDGQGYDPVSVHHLRWRGIIP
jgi:4-amino-4-deoxy-L-arabinose transferase-like glycosyltransferase